MIKKRETVILDRRFVPKGTVVVKEGELGAQAYLIQSGEVRVFTSHEKKEVELARLGVGQIFGEIALIFDSPRTASVEATQDCNLIVITRNQFKDKLEKTDATIRATIHMLTNRIIDSNNTLMNKKSSLNDLKETARIIYQNIAAGLPRNQMRTFQNTVLPSLDGLIEAIEGFKDRYGEDDKND